MDHRDEVREFLTSRRAKLDPADAGLPPSPNRRVTGLRRAEVALLANVSVEYYTRIERGHLAGVSENILDAIARAIRLDDAERVYLFNLARAANRTPPARARRDIASLRAVRPALRQLLDAIDAPAAIRNGALDLVAANRTGVAFYTDVFTDPANQGNLARFVFLGRESAARFMPDWEQAADICVAILRAETGTGPTDEYLQDLITELADKSDAFRAKWATRDVRIHGRGEKQVHHPVVGELHVAFEELDLAADPGLTLLVYTAEPASESEKRLHQLSDWARSHTEPQAIR